MNESFASGFKYIPLKIPIINSVPIVKLSGFL